MANASVYAYPSERVPRLSSSVGAVAEALHRTARRPTSILELVILLEAPMAVPALLMADAELYAHPLACVPRCPNSVIVPDTPQRSARIPKGSEGGSVLPYLSASPTIVPTSLIARARPPKNPLGLPNSVAAVPEASQRTAPPSTESPDALYLSAPPTTVPASLIADTVTCVDPPGPVPRCPSSMGVAEASQRTARVPWPYHPAKSLR